MAIDTYIDFSATNNGDGSTAAQAGSPGGVGARNTFALTNYSSASTWNIWIRRVSSFTLAATLTFNQANINLIGWPKAGDPDFSTRPASGTSNGWDSDTQVYASFQSSDKTKVVNISTQNAQVFRRIEFLNSDSTATVSNNWVSVSCSPEITNSHIKGNKSTALNVTGSPSVSGCTIESSAAGTALSSTNNDAQYTSCVFQNYSSTANGVIVLVTNGNRQLFQDCNFTVTSGTLSQVLLNIITDTSHASKIFFLGCVFDSGTITVWGDSLQLQAACQMLDCTFSGGRITSSGGNIWDPGTWLLHFTNLSWPSIQPADTDFYINLASPLRIVADNVLMSGFVAHQLIQGYSGSKFLFHNTKLPHDYTINGVGFSQSYKADWVGYPGLYSVDHMGVQDSWKQINDSGISDGFSLACNTFDTHGGFPSGRAQPLELNDPEDDVQFVQLKAGTNHISASVFSPGINEDVWFEIEYYDGASAHRAVASALGQNASPMSNFQTITLTISVNKACIMPYRFYARGNGSDFVIATVNVT